MRCNMKEGERTKRKCASDEDCAAEDERFVHRRNP